MHRDLLSAIWVLVAQWLERNGTVKWIIIIIIIIIKLRCQICKFVHEVWLHPIAIRLGGCGMCVWWFNFCHVRVVVKSMLDTLLRFSYSFYITTFKNSMIHENQYHVPNLYVMKFLLKISTSFLRLRQFYSWPIRIYFLNILYTV